MPLEGAGSTCRQIPPLFEKRAKVPRMAAEMLPVHPPQADIEKPSLTEEPAVAFQIPAEKQRRRIGGKAAEALLVPAHGELRRLGDNDLLPADSCAEQARHRAEMAPRADHEPGTDAPVDEPPPVATFQRRHRFARQLPHAAPQQQVMIELAAPDAVTDG